jgi:D-lactate dehydrogenase
MLNGNYHLLYDRLRSVIPANRLYHDDLRTLALGTDASFYRLLPKLVVRANDETEVSLILRSCAALNLPVTFRAAGTSLSGQAISDSVLVVIDQGWKNIRIDEGGELVRLQPGVLGCSANKALLPFGRKIGPDPASIDAAMIGGIAANNASGMCCGTAQNSYRTLAGLRLLLADGTLLDGLEREAVAAFRRDKAELLNTLLTLRQKILAKPQLAERVRDKFKMKNTCGYSLNALIDFEDPVDILQHLMIGSEGTLGFLSEIGYHTVPEYRDKASSLIIFPDIENACRAVSILKSAPVEAVEIMDRAALRSVENKAGMPDYLAELPPAAAALLIETRAATPDLLQGQIETIRSMLSGVPVLIPVTFTLDPAEYGKLWNIRKGLFPAVGAMRQTGTTVIIEDVAFPVPRLAEATLELQHLFRKHGYDDTIIFGHSLAGNLHFVFKQNFNLSAEVERYRRFMDEVCHMVVEKYDGALKAEHGTGRNMAPYIGLEWGEEAVAIMHEIKALFDPGKILNPGVILNDDPEIHLKNLKPLPAAHDLVDKCIECGFCEPHCVSNQLTLSARQRIVVYREISRLSATGEEPHRLAQLQDGFDYFGDQTCATDGLCALACPVEIDTGKLVKHLRHSKASPLARRLAGALAGRMSRVTASARLGLRLVHWAHLVLGTSLLGGITRALRALSGSRLPLWTPQMPKNSRRLKMDKLPVQTSARGEAAPKVVYFPSCITRSMGPAQRDNEKADVPNLTMTLLKKAGFEVILPERCDELCCGMAFASKGFKEAGDHKAAELNEALWRASREGEYPVLTDMSPCLYRMQETLDDRLKLYEPIAFTLGHLAPRLDFHPLPETVMIHTVCSARKMGLEPAFLKLARLCAAKVVASEGTCCGFAGDRGFTYPELNAHGLRHLREQVPEGCTEGFSTSRTCEIGLSTHSGIPFKSILYLVDRCTTARQR